MATKQAGPGRPRLPYDPKTAADRERRRLHSAQQRRKNAPVHSAIIDAFLSNPCVDCGEQYPLPAMHPDHVRPKKYKIAWFRGGNGTAKMLQDELDKCEVRCANCHCIRHAYESRKLLA